jgi:topoisomerase-4 subunit A
MSKRKHPSDSDQPELPLGGDQASEQAKGAKGLPPEPAPVSPVPPVQPEAAAAIPDSGEALAVSAQPESTASLTNGHDAPLAQHYKQWFLEYASYVILDRAVPHIDDGLKPVQRRILHTLFEMDDGRFHKVANVTGQTMALHPHGDASISAALVAIAQRAMLIQPQGNFGNPITGDGPAAPRYIEARLTPFARDVLFNPKTTTWQLSYDGRKNEPVTLPAKFPVVLLEGAEGIAVGLTTKILPHNFNDLCRACINHLQGKRFRIFPDFHSGGIADFSEYGDGERGSKVKVRAKIEQRTKYLLAITEIPYGTTTTGLIDSILAANAKGKIKVKHIDDNTAENVEILIHLPQGADPDQLIQQLYVFTDCQMTLSPAACVIDGERPVFLGVSEIVRRSADRTMALLKAELEIRLGELEQEWHWDSLERIFIEERVYRRIEKSSTWESVLQEIRDGLKPFLKNLRREVTHDDIVRLTEIRIKRISAYNRFQADERIKKIEEEMKGVRHHLKHLVDYAVKWFEGLQEKYGKGIKRRTTYDEIEQISAAQVVSANQRLYVNREEGFIGLNWRQHEFLQECTILDDVLCIMGDATMKVARVADKVFMGRDIQHVAILPKEGDTAFYTLIYQDKESGKAFAKRFQIGGVTREKLYQLAASEGSKCVYLHVAKTEADMPAKVEILLSGRCSARKKEFEFDLSSLSVGARGNKGVTVTEYPIRQVRRAD